MDDGRIRVDALLTRSGVFTYLNPDGSERREYRPPEEVFNTDSISSAEGIPVTDDHPVDMLDAKNARRHAAGALMGTPRQDGNYLSGPLTIYDESLIKKMDSGKIETSCGYRCEIVKSPGVSPDGERYDVIQRKIRYNHVAIVDVGRAGSTRVRMDAAQMVAPNLEKNMKDRTDKDALLTAASQLAAAEQRAALAEGKLAAETQRADAAEGRVSALEVEVKSLGENQTDLNQLELKDKTIKEQTARADAAEQKLMAVPEIMKEAVKSRVLLEKHAFEVMGGKFRMDDLSDREIMVTVVEKLHGVSIDDDRSDDYARARFDAAVEGHRNGHLALARIVESTVENATKTEKRTDIASIREASHDQMRKKWMEPLPSAARKDH